MFSFGMTKKNPKSKKDIKARLKRLHKHAFALNELEQKALDFYCKRYKIENKTKFIRETLMAAIIKQCQDDSTLFDKKELEIKKTTQPAMVMFSVNVPQQVSLNI